MTARKCLWCDTPLPNDSSIRRLYCDDRCRNAYLRNGYNKASYDNSMKSICLFCGKPFRKSRKDNSCCSRKCVAQRCYYSNLEKYRESSRQYFNNNKAAMAKKSSEYYKKHKAHILKRNMANFNSKREHFNKLIRERRRREGGKTRERSFCYSHFKTQAPPKEAKYFAAILYIVKLLLNNKLQPNTEQTNNLLIKINKGETHAAYEIALRH